MAAGLKPLQTSVPHLVLPDTLSIEAADYYDAASDSYLLNFGTPHAALAWNIEGDIWIRYLPETGEVVGVEVENFTYRFLPTHPELAATWDQGRQAQPTLNPGTVEQPTSRFLDQLLSVLRQKSGDGSLRASSFA